MEKEETIRIVDVNGGQPGDFIAFNFRNLSEHFSQIRTRVENCTCRPTTGHKLWTNVLPPNVMFTITDDTAGNHDLLYAPCSRNVLEKRFGVSRDGCQKNLAGALEPWNISLQQIPDPLNLFFGVNLSADGSITIGEHRFRSGEYIELRAHMECLVAVSEERQ